MATVKIWPQGEYEIGVGEGEDGRAYCVIQLPDNRTGDVVEIGFDIAAFVTFADWVRMIADELIVDDKNKPPAK